MKRAILRYSSLLLSCVLSSLFSSAHSCGDLLLLPGKLADNDYFFAEPKTFTWKSGKLTEK